MARFLKYSPVLTSILVALAGLMSLAQVLAFTVHHHRFGHIDDSLLPVTAAQNSRLFIVALGLLLLYLSSQIFRRKYIAYQLVVTGLAILIGTELFLSRNTVQLVLYALTLTLLLVTHKQYTVATNNLSLRRGIIISGIIILVVFAYATIGFSRLSEHEVGAKLSVPSAMKYAAREVFTFQENQLPLETRNARLFVLSVNAAAVIAYGLAIVSLFRPLQFQYGASRHERDLARRILEEHSSSTDDFFKLWPLDKHYFFSPDQDSFLAYKVIGSDALVLGEPNGDSKTFKQLLERFADFCHQSGWAVAFLSAGDELSQYLDSQYQRLFIGNEAVIDVPTFATETFRSKHFRYIKNRAERDGLEFEYWTSPLDDEQLRHLRAVSNAWLNQRSRREYTFALGYFDNDYIRNCDAAVLTQGGKVVAYANVVPSFIAEARTIDHMRYKAHMPPSGMHFLLMQLILRLHENGVKKFNLGLAPLSGLESREASNLPERLLTVLKKLGSNYYSFGGLEQFKNKFEPIWQPRYLYYQGTPARLLRLTSNLARAITVPVAGRMRRQVVITMSVLAALCYNAFPMAFILNPHKALQVFPSELGAGGQEYAGVFNALSAISSLLIFIIILLLWNDQEDTDRRNRQILILLGISAFGALIAAVAPIPLRAGSAIQFTLHDVFSAVNTIGIIGAGVLLTTVVDRKRALGALSSVLITAVAVAALYEGRYISVLAQHLQIVLTGIWFIIITVYTSRHTIKNAIR